MRHKSVPSVLTLFENSRQKGFAEREDRHPTAAIDGYTVVCSAMSRPVCGCVLNPGLATRLVGKGVAESLAWRQTTTARWDTLTMHRFASRESFSIGGDMSSSKHLKVDYAPTCKYNKHEKMLQQRSLLTFNVLHTSK